MRRSFQLLSIAVSLVFLASPALAQKKPKGKKAEASAAATWTDPVEKEKSDKGPFTPKTEEDNEPVPVEKPKTKADPGRKRDKIEAFGQIIIGYGKVPLNSPQYDNSPSNNGTAVGFLVGGRYDVIPAFDIGLRVPVTTASIRQVNGKSLSTTSWGSPEVFGEYRVSLSKLTTVPIGFGLGIPVAQGNLDAHGTDTVGIQKDLVNRFADATSGWKDSELFQPKRMPIVVGAGVRHERRDWELHADAKFVFLPGFGNKTVTQPNNSFGLGTYKINGFAMREVTTLGGSYNFIDNPRFWGGLDFSLVWTPAEAFVFDPTTNVTKPSSVQAVFEPKVGARFKMFEPSLGYVAPVGGRLGTTGAGGIRLHLSAFF